MKPRRNRLRFLPALLIALAAVAIAALLLNDMNRNLALKQAEQLKADLYAAAVDCYVDTGRYPQSAQALADYGGIRYSEDLFYIGYERYADNLIPQISVFVREEAP